MYVTETPGPGCCVLLVLAAVVIGLLILGAAVSVGMFIDRLSSHGVPRVHAEQPEVLSRDPGLFSAILPPCCVAGIPDQTAGGFAIVANSSAWTDGYIPYGAFTFNGNPKECVVRGRDGYFYAAGSYAQQGFPFAEILRINPDGTPAGVFAQHYFGASLFGLAYSRMKINDVGIFAQTTDFSTLPSSLSPIVSAKFSRNVDLITSSGSMAATYDGFASSQAGANNGTYCPANRALLYWDVTFGSTLKGKLFSSGTHLAYPTWERDDLGTIVDVVAW